MRESRRKPSVRRLASLLEPGSTAARITSTSGGPGRLPLVAAINGRQIAAILTPVKALAIRVNFPLIAAVSSAVAGFAAGWLFQRCPLD
jgi:hypothetical protein